jgi:hypothetical protein
MITYDLSILNQKGTPMFYSDTFALRPAFGVVGRIFISTDTAQIFRDTGTSWVLIADGAGSSTNIYNSDGTLTAARTLNTNNHNLRFEGAANTLRFRLSANNNIPRILSFATANVARWALRVDGNETGSNVGGDFAIRRYNDAGTFVDSPILINRELGKVAISNTMTASASSRYEALGVVNITSIPAATTFVNGGAGCSAFFQNTTTYNGNATYQQDTTSGTTSMRNVITFPNIGSVVTIDQFIGATRAMSAIHSSVAMLSSQSGTISHLAGLFIQNPIRVSTGTTTLINNYFGVLVNPSDAATALTYTNRWGIYQEGINDPNYFAGKVSIGSTTLGSEALRVTGTALFSGEIVVNGVINIGFGGGAITTNLRVGNSALQNNTLGASNTALGVRSLGANTTGSSNTAIGLDAMRLNTSGFNNTAVGLDAMRNSTTSTGNNAFGVNALFSNTTGNSNTAIGVSSLTSNTTASSNTAVGVSSLTSNTTGTTNTAIGVSALQSNTTGNNNTANGVGSLQNNTTGNANTALGRDSGRFITGGVTTNTITNNSIFLGYNTRAAADNQTNQIVIGYQETGLGSNTTIIGNTSTTLTALRGSIILGATAINASAQLQVDSTTKGFLPPRMDTTQKNAIVTPAAGLVIYDTTLNKLCVYTTGWETITSL